MINDRVLTMSQNTLRLSDRKSSSESCVTWEQTIDTRILRALTRSECRPVVKSIDIKPSHIETFRCLLWYLICIKINETRTRAKSKYVSFLRKIRYFIYLRNETCRDSSRQWQFSKNRVDNVIDIINVYIDEIDGYSRQIRYLLHEQKSYLDT